MKYVVYAHKSKVNGKVYVGITSKTIKWRWSEHCRKDKYRCGLNSGNYFQRAIVKYGVGNWESNILEICDLLETVEAAEVKWIKHYKSNDKRFGYNLTEGGNVSQSVLDPRVREKISKSVSKIVNDPDYKEKQSKALKQWHQK